MTPKRLKNRLEHCADMVVRYLLVDKGLEVQAKKKSALKVHQPKTSK